VLAQPVVRSAHDMCGKHILHTYTHSHSINHSLAHTHAVEQGDLRGVTFKKTVELTFGFFFRGARRCPRRQCSTLGLATALGNLGVCHRELGNTQMLTFFVNAR
jgi:hypothetical protein